MDATSTVVRGPQYMRALERANEVRLARAALKRRVAHGDLRVAEVIRSCPWEARSMEVADLLMSQRRWGRTRARRFLAGIPMSETKTISSMTDRQRTRVCEQLAELGEPVAPLKTVPPTEPVVRAEPAAPTAGAAPVEQADEADEVEILDDQRELAAVCG